MVRTPTPERGDDMYNDARSVDNGYLPLQANQASWNDALPWLLVLTRRRRSATHYTPVLGCDEEHVLQNSRIRTVRWCLCVRRQSVQVIEGCRSERQTPSLGHAPLHSLEDIRAH